MSGKKNKKLRNLAQENTVGEPQVKYDGFIAKRYDNGLQRYRIELQEGCTRHEVKRLKKSYKQKR